MLPEWYAFRTHCSVCGTTQSGKSKFCEHCMREHVIEGNGFCLIDWHGTLYQNMLDFLAYVQPDRPIVLLNPSQPDFITPFNPFALPEGAEVTSQVIRLAEVLVKPWGAKNTNELPTYERVVKMVFSFMAYSGEPLHHAARLLEFPRKELREYAVSVIKNNVKQEWVESQYIHTLKEWTHEVLSTRNRLGRFIGSKSVRLFTGLKGNGLDINKAIADRAIVLVNLTHSHNLPADSGRVFASLLLSEFLDTAINHADEERPYFVYLDECANYLTGDAAKILDQVIKTGLRFTFAFHHLGQFFDKPHLLQSLDVNARVKVQFAGATVQAAKNAAEECCMPELNERWIKEITYRTVTKHFLEAYDTSTETDGEIPAGSTHSSSTASGTRYSPYTEREEAGKVEWSREEKIAKIAQRFMSLGQRECYVKTPDGAFPYTVPWVEEILQNPLKALQFEKDLQSTAIPLHEAETILETEERKFLERGNQYESKGGRPKKRPARLHPQG